MNTKHYLIKIKPSLDIYADKYLLKSYPCAGTGNFGTSHIFGTHIPDARHFPSMNDVLEFCASDAGAHIVRDWYLDVVTVENVVTTVEKITTL